ncbi:MAG: hypothetical protein M3Q46_04135 [Verrucomicrobiota bacterium]|nr:hypothetical protein [Verrucomicrobiota bacterium]
MSLALWKKLQRHLPRQRLVLGQPDHAHPAPAKDALQPVTTNITVSGFKPRIVSPKSRSSGEGIPFI